MPKEIIHSRHAGVTVTDLDGKPVPAETTEARVGWTKDYDHLELAVVNPARGAEHDEQAGWFVQLDRAGVNRLIRTLRRARDQAFGADA